MNDLVQASFDTTVEGLPECYTGLSAETVDSLEQDAKDIYASAGRASFEIGAKLVSARDKYRHNKHGGFDGWIEQRLKFGRRTAYNVIYRYEQFSTVQDISQLDIVLTAQYQLSAPSTPQEARDEAIQRAASGEKITVATAQEIIDAQQAQKRAEEEAQKARDEVECAHQQLWQAQEVSQKRSEQLNEQIAKLKLQIDALSTQKDQSQINELQTTVRKLTQQRDNLAKRAQDLGAELDEQRDANEARRKEEQYAFQIQQKWRKVTETFHTQVIQLLTQFPLPLETQVFEADDWMRLEQVKELARRFLAECDKLSRGSLGVIVDAMEA